MDSVEDLRGEFIEVQEAIDSALSELLPSESQPFSFESEAACEAFFRQLQGEIEAIDSKAAFSSHFKNVVLRDPFSIPAKWVETEDDFEEEAVTTQDKKDWQRERVSVNGVEVFAAAEERYDAIVAAIRRAIGELDAFVGLSDRAQSMEMCEQVVSAASRTKTGGDCWALLYKIFGPLPAFVVSATNSGDSLVDISVSVGMVQGQHGLGVQVTVPAFFRVMHANLASGGDLEEWSTFKLSFHRCWRILPGATVEAADEGGRIGFALEIPKETAAAGETGKEEEEEEESDVEGEVNALIADLDFVQNKQVEDDPMGADVASWPSSVLQWTGTTQPLSVIPFHAMLGCPRILSLSCSGWHAGAISDSGLLYMWGSSEDGALGLGEDVKEVRVPQFVQWFVKTRKKGEDVIKIEAASCGGDLGGCHTLAVDSDGVVYSWGIGTACGHGELKNFSLPKAIKSSRFGGEPVERVSAGGGFSLALTLTGQLYSWGKWANGRLGLGEAPKPTGGGRRSRSLMRVRLPRFQFSPKAVKVAGARFSGMSAGESHSLAATQDGEVYSWGAGSAGQLGNGSMKDVLSPAMVEFPAGLAGRKDVFIVSVSAGSAHSLAVDRNGGLWSWGADGGPALGQGETVKGWPASLYPVDPLSGVQKMAVDEAATKFEAAVARAEKRRELQEALFWTVPRRVMALGTEVQTCSAGLLNSVVCTKGGKVYVWGCFTEPDLHEHWSDVLRRHERPDGADDCVLWSPRLMELNETGQRHDGEYRNCLGKAWVAVAGGNRILALSFRSAIGDDYFRSLCTGTENIGGQAVLWETGWGTDMTLLVNGRKIFAHKLILASRSPAMAKLISDRELPGQRLELILPDLRFDVAVGLIEFLYCGSLPRCLLPSDRFTRMLLRASKRYEVPYLQELCEYAVGEGGLDGSPSDALPDPPVVMLPGLYDGIALHQRWADVLLVSGDETERFWAHRIVLSCRSYFFQDRLADTSCFPQDEMNMMVTIQLVGTSPSTVQRLLRFIYDGVVEEMAVGDGAALLQAAVQFGVYGLAEICQEYLAEKESVENVATLLDVSTVAQASQTAERCMDYVVENLHKIVPRTEFASLSDAHPALLETVLTRSHLHTLVRQGEEDARAAIGMFLEAKKEEAEKEEEGKKVAAKWQWIIVGIMGVVLALTLTFAQLSRDHPSLAAFVPGLNIAALILVIVWVGYFISH